MGQGSEDDVRVSEQTKVQFRSQDLGICRHFRDPVQCHQLGESTLHSISSHFST